MPNPSRDDAAWLKSLEDDAIADIEGRDDDRDPVRGIALGAAIGAALGLASLWVVLQWLPTMMRAFRLQGWVWLFGIALLASAALADPPPGTDRYSPEHLWWECQLSVENRSCCGEADGMVLADNEWRQTPAGYQVLFKGRWLDVPAGRMSRPTSGCGLEPNIENRDRAKAWFNVTEQGVYVVCFQPGALL